ncbi:MAG: hypothetical protein CMC80_01525 [Flavobacteriaceae bacterium]|nr:hypothetical protein [Flavobacteriaceae bacterium]|tara:strand:- start:331 stop:1356 length:1026 start_codon:yes stop_codon:yes gene_type:complete
MKNLIFSILTLSLSVTSVNAQLFDGIENILLTSTEDARILAEGYTDPIGKTLTYALNSGWATSAKTHKKLGFGLTIGGAAPFVPDVDQVFTPTGLTSLSVPSGSLSTVFGEGGDQELNFSFSESVLGNEIEYEGKLSFPGGLKDELPLGTVPAPIVQASVGVVFDTDLLVRFIPTMEMQGSTFSLTGFGLKHNIMQYFGPLEKLPLNVSVLAAISKASFEYDLSDSTFGGNSTNRKMTFEADTFTIQALASIDLPIISAFAGLGYNAGDSQFNVSGDYSIDYGITGIGPRILKDPISIASDASGVMGIVGARLNLLFLKIFANYTIQEYNTLTAGISFNFR